MKYLDDFKLFTAKCIRVWRILKKPDMKEYKTIAKVSAIGILIIGMAGFIIAIVINLFR